MATEAAARPRARTAEPSRGVFWFPLAVETAFFAAVIALVLAGERLRRPAAVTVMAGGEFIWFFLSAFAAATVLLILMLRSRRGPRWFGGLFSLALFIGVGIVAERFLGSAWAVLVVSAAVLFHYSLRRVVVFDLVLVLGLAGISLNLGEAIQPTAALIILSILSLYDIFAVFVTGHMVAAAEALLRQKALFAIIVPVAPGDFLERLSEVTPGGRFLHLGTGDVVLPALLIASVGRGGLYPALPVVIGAFVGLAATHLIFMSQARRRPIPALPPIAMGAILGYLVTFLFNA